MFEGEEISEMVLYIPLHKHFMAYAIVEAIQFNYIKSHRNSAS